jgi:hypothetical protein
VQLQPQLAIASLLAWAFAGSAAFAQDLPRVLVFSVRHDSIEAGIELVRALGEAYGFAVDATESSVRSTFTMRASTMFTAELDLIRGELACL